MLVKTFHSFINQFRERLERKATWDGSPLLLALADTLLVKLSFPCSFAAMARLSRAAQPPGMGRNKITTFLFPSHQAQLNPGIYKTKSPYIWTSTPNQRSLKYHKRSLGSSSSNSHRQSKTPTSNSRAQHRFNIKSHSFASTDSFTIHATTQDNTQSIHYHTSQWATPQCQPSSLLFCSPAAPSALDTTPTSHHLGGKRRHSFEQRRVCSSSSPCFYLPLPRSERRG